MILCPRCKGIMHTVMHFTKEKNYKNKVCTQCYYETKPEKIKFDNIIENKQYNIKYNKDNKNNNTKMKPNNNNNSSKKKNIKKKNQK